MTSLLSNLHLLLRVPSFARWPLELRFFCPAVHKSWLRWCKTVAEPMRDTLNIVTDFPPLADATSSDVCGKGEAPSSSPRGQKRKATHGIGALDVAYEDVKSHVEKGKSIMEFEREGACAVCSEELEHDGGVYAICPRGGCEAVSHLTCLSGHFLKEQEKDAAGEDVLLPIKGSCPTCKAEVTWIDVVKELTLRMRGQKEVEKLLQVKRVRKSKGTATASQPVVESEDEEEDDELEDEISEDGCNAAGGTHAMSIGSKSNIATDLSMGDAWHEVDDADNSDTGSIASNLSQSRIAAPYTSTVAEGKTKLGTVIEDSDWDEADVIE